MCLFIFFFKYSFYSSFLKPLKHLNRVVLKFGGIQKPYKLHIRWVALLRFFKISTVKLEYVLLKLILTYKSKELIQLIRYTYYVN